MTNLSITNDSMVNFYPVSAKRVLVITLMTFTDVFVIVANIFVIFVISRSAKLRGSQSSLFVVNLCVLDLLAGGTILPKSIAVYIADAWPWNYNTCIANGFLNIFVSFATIFAICVITMEKYYCIKFPMHHAGNMTVYKTLVLIILTWALAVVFATLPIMGWNAYEFNKYSGCCWPGHKRNAQNQALMLLYFTVVFVMPVLLMAIINFNLYRVAKQVAVRIQPTNTLPLSERIVFRRNRHSCESVCRISTIKCDPYRTTNDTERRIQNVTVPDQRISIIVRPVREMHDNRRSDRRVPLVPSRPSLADQTPSALYSASFTYDEPVREAVIPATNNFKAFKTLIVTFASFLIFWGPYFILQIYIVMHGHIPGKHILGPVVTWLSYMSYALNPLVYGCFNSQIREECFNMLQRVCCKQEIDETRVINISRMDVSREDFFQFLQRTCSAETLRKA